MSKIPTLELFRCCRMKEPSDDNKGEPRFCHMYQTLREITVMLNISFELFLAGEERFNPKCLLNVEEVV